MSKSLMARIRSALSIAANLVLSERLKTNLQQAIPFWVASLLTGLIAVGYTWLFNRAEEQLHRALAWHDWLIFIAAPVNLLAGWYIVRLFAPNAKGSGIPQVMAAINLSAPGHEHTVSRLLSLRIILAKIASSIFLVLGGAAIGREGPTIQIAASVFRIVRERVPATWRRLSDQNFVITGAAAGLAAAFNTPLGGIVFAVEELAKIHISRIRTALFTAVIIAGLTAQALLGPYLYLGYPDVRNLRTPVFFGVIAAAIAAGLLGAGMCRLILRLLRWRQKLGHVQTVLVITVTGLTIACVAYFLNVQILGSGKDLMNQTLFTTEKHVSWHTMALRIIGPVLAFNTGGAGGVFAPSLAAGAAVGSFISGLFDVAGANANILILGGMVGFLTGVTRTPFTSAILVLEMTDRHSVIFHLMLAGLVAGLAARLVDRHSLYDRLKQGFVMEAKQESAAGGGRRGR